jgi:predicted enzyme related to lactoylglutathione lyase
MQGVNPVGWFEIYVQDMDRAQKFYETVFGISMINMLDPSSEGVTMRSFSDGENSMAQTGATGALVHMEGFESGGNSTIVYFVSEDCSVEESRVASAGGSVFKSKFSIGEHGFISLCTDTEGNMFGIHSMA